MKLDDLTTHKPLPEKPARDLDHHIQRAEVKFNNVKA